MLPDVHRPAGIAVATLVAEVGAGTLLRALLVALVVVAPYFFVTRRRVRAARAASAAGDGPTDHGSTDDGPPEPEDPAALEPVVARLGSLGADLDPGSSTVVEVPADATVDGRPVPTAVRDAVLADALARSGLTETARRTDGAGGLVIEVRRA